MNEYNLTGFNFKLDLWFSAPVLKNYAYTSVLVILGCIENKKEWPNLCSKCLERARSRWLRVFQGCCEKSGKIDVFML